MTGRKLVCCYATGDGRRYYWLETSRVPDAHGRVHLTYAFDSSRGYNALPSEFREVTDPGEVADVGWWIEKLRAK